MIRTPWRPELQWQAALTAAQDWRNTALLALYLGQSGVPDPWLEDGEVDGYTFVALHTPEDIEAEAIAMHHCVRTYGSSIAGNDSRLFGVRRDGARVATLSLASGLGPWPYINEISGPRNAVVAADVWLAARRWLHAQDVPEQAPERLTYKDAKFDAGTWRQLWRPYWLAKRRIPAWLPLAADENGFHDL